MVDMVTSAGLKNAIDAHICLIFLSVGRGFDLFQSAVMRCQARIIKTKC